MFSNVPHHSKIRRHPATLRHPSRLQARRIVTDAVVTGTAASLTSAAALMLCSANKGGSIAAGLNGPGMVAVYVAFAAGLAFTAIARDRKR